MSYYWRMNQANHGTEMGKFIAAIQDSVESLPMAKRARGSLVPDSAALELAIDLFRSLAFPGFFAAQRELKKLLRLNLILKKKRCF